MHSRFSGAIISPEKTKEIDMVVKKTKKTAAPKKAKKEKVLGKADHYYDHIKVLTMTLKAPLKIGDLIHIKGHTTDFVQTLESMQIDHKDVKKAKKGDGVGIKVSQLVRDTDIVYFADKKTAITPKAAFNPILPSQVMPKISPMPQKSRPQQKEGGARFLSF